MNIDFYDNKKIAVFGLGISGTSVAHFLLDKGADVVVWDENKNKLDDITDKNLKILDLNKPDLKQFDFIVVSPGISNENPICKNAIKNKIPLIGEVQLLWETNRQAKYIGITGTNGKSTTTALISHILNTAKIKNVVGGNFGTPAVSLEKLNKGEFYILEMSSYMLERTPNVNFDISLFINLTSDHLQWHKTMDNYFNAKAKIFNNIKDDNTPIICTDDKYGKKLDKQINHKNKITVSVKDIKKSYDNLKGKHNNQNIACAVAVAKQVGIDEYTIENAIKSFKGLKHRQQIIKDDNNILFINDSKATNPVSATNALSSYENIYLIAGGQEKDSDYTILSKNIKNVIKVFVIGENSKNLLNYLETTKIPYENCQTLENATLKAYETAKKNNNNIKKVILLSPACASFDKFKNFEHRGDCFIKIVESLNND